MTTIRVIYPHYGSREPRPMKTEAIWRIAAEVRRQAAVAPARRRLDSRAAIDRTRRLVVNGVGFAVIRDIAGTVHDEDGREVMGVCEHDADEPDQVMISLNRGILAERPDLLRSTTGHELGHAVFDMPAAVQGERQLRLNLGEGPVVRRAFRIVSPGPEHLRDSRSANGPMDWREWRANEFMGALLAPPDRLHRSLLSLARQAGLPVTFQAHRGKMGYPVVDTRGLDGADLQPVADALTDEFGLSEAFIWRRLVKYRLLHGYDQGRQ